MQGVDLAQNTFWNSFYPVKQVFFETRVFLAKSFNGIVSNNIVIADCDLNEHISAILEYGASETVPDWTVTCGYRG